MFLSKFVVEGQLSQISRIGHLRVYNKWVHEVKLNFQFGLQISKFAESAILATFSSAPFASFDAALAIAEIISKPTN